MPMKPHKGESQDAFMARCVPDMIGTGPDKRPQDQAVAACLNIWREAKKAAKDLSDDAPEVDDDESHEDYIDRCVDELTSGDDGADEDEAEDACQLAWEDRGAKRGSAIRHKVHADTVTGMEFCLSDESIDRMGDIIKSAGWVLDNFKNNPIALPDLAAVKHSAQGIINVNVGARLQQD